MKTKIRFLQRKGMAHPGYVCEVESDRAAKWVKEGIAEEVKIEDTVEQSHSPESLPVRRKKNVPQ